MLKRRQAHGSRPPFGVELAVPTAMAVAVVVLMVALVGGSDRLVSDIAAVVGSFQAGGQSEQGGLAMIEDGPSVCCEGFYTGGRLALAVVLLGGIPLAVVGLVSARRSDGAGSIRWAMRWEALVRWCLVFQLMNLALAGFLALVVLYTRTSSGPLVIGTSALTAFLIANIGMSALAVGAWRTVQRSLRPSDDLGISR